MAADIHDKLAVVPVAEAAVGLVDLDLAAINQI